MSTKAEWAELFESVHGRKPSPQEFLDAKAADFDTSVLIAQVASVQEAANEPVAEEVPAEQASSESPLEMQPSQKHLLNNRYHNLIQACLKKHLSLQLKDLELYLIP